MAKIEAGLSLLLPGSMNQIRVLSLMPTLPEPRLPKPGKGLLVMDHQFVHVSLSIPTASKGPGPQREPLIGAVWAYSSATLGILQSTLLQG